jgi:SAM-dependent methyltransferase
MNAIAQLTPLDPPAPTTPNRALWEKGDFTRIADTMRPAGADLVDRIGIRAGARVLDLGCGDGTTAIPEAERGADVLGVDIAANLVAAGRKQTQERGLDTIRFEVGDARDLSWIPDDSFDTVVSVFGAMFAPEPQQVAAEMVRVTRPGGRIVMGNWIPGDPTLVAQILKISSAYSPPPPEGFVSPMTWGVPEQVAERFTAAGVAAADITCEPDTFVFETDASPTAFLGTFRDFYGPTMNAFAAAAADGRADELFAELDALFNAQNQSPDPTTTRIPATFLRVTVDV